MFSHFSAVEVRLRVLQCFKDGDPLLLSHLAQADMLDSIFMTLHDEKLEMQEHAVALLGKLGSLNPAYVLPSLRNVLLETLTQLTNSGVPRLAYYNHLHSELVNHEIYCIFCSEKRIYHCFLPYVKIW